MKAARFYVSKPLNATWQELGKTLRDLQYKTAKALNYCMTEWFLYERSREEWKNKKGKYPTAKELPSPNRRLYAEIRNLYPEISARMVDAINQKARQRWQTDRKEVYYIQSKSLPSFRKTHPVIIDNQSIRYSKDDNGYIFTATLLSQKGEGIKRCSLILNTKKISPSQRSLIKGIFSGEITSKSAMIGWNERKRKWYVNVSYEPPKSDVALDPNRIVGVDFGVRNAFCCAVSDSPQRLYADGWEIEKFRRNIRRRRISYQRQAKVSGRGGHGRKKILEPVESLSKKERNFRDTKYHKYSKVIVDFAVKNNAGTIVIEDLDSLKQSKQENFILKDWALADLQTKLAYKASEYGIEITEVNPRYTSQRCSKCGHIDRANRPRNAAAFQCVSCGFKADADYNASKNLTIKGIDSIIDEEIANLQLTQEHK